MEPEPDTLDVIAFDIQCSEGGKTFVTRDGDSLLHVWNFANFELIHSIPYKEQATGMAMSPDGRRIYNIAGSYCDVWQPKALEAASSDTGTAGQPGAKPVAAKGSEASISVFDSVRSIALSHQSYAYYVAYTSGRLAFHESPDSEAIELDYDKIAADNFVTHVTLNHSDNLLVTVDNIGQLLLWSAKAPALDKKPIIIEKAKVKHVQQLLISQDSRFLIVAARDTTQLWSLNPCLEMKQENASNPGASWIQHPVRGDTVMEILPDQVRLLNLTSLSKTETFSFDKIAFDLGTSTPRHIEIQPRKALFTDDSLVDKAFVSLDAKTLLL